MKEGAIEYLLGVLDKQLTQIGVGDAEKQVYQSDYGKELSEAFDAVKKDTVIEMLYALYENNADALEKDVADIVALGESLYSEPVFHIERKRALQNILFASKGLFSPDFSELLSK